MYYLCGMEPIIHFTDYSSLYFEINTTQAVRNERDAELLKQIISDRQRFKMGGNKGVHKPNDAEVFGNGISLRSA